MGVGMVNKENIMKPIGTSLWSGLLNAFSELRAGNWFKPKPAASRDASVFVAHVVIVPAYAPIAALSVTARPPEAARSTLRVNVAETIQSVLEVQIESDTELMLTTRVEVTAQQGDIVVTFLPYDPKAFSPKISLTAPEACWGELLEKGKKGMPILNLFGPAIKDGYFAGHANFLTTDIVLRVGKGELCKMEYFTLGGVASTPEDFLGDALTARAERPLRVVVTIDFLQAAYSSRLSGAFSRIQENLRIAARAIPKDTTRGRDAIPNVLRYRFGGLTLKD